MLGLNPATGAAAAAAAAMGWNGWWRAAAGWKGKDAGFN